MIKNSKRVSISKCMGFGARYRVNTKDAKICNKVLDEFLNMLKKRKLNCGGGGLEDFSGFIIADRNRCYGATEEDRAAIEKWGEKHQMVAVIKTTPLIDANLDDADEIEL
ncbi:50S ribosome-binding protein YggL [Pectinatus brassicae]|uniref:Uncharacterized protein YggL (DUF469 family) n=1 Tax=Pectinatus brassicae TaxID=862415 RepID=A0A840UN81_9FIRM|nr:50S ribosome-binding protein YggL [Pectinatus brassicae]MBB5335692.1 uncharacterized protein YggL (DUF469 family) [Pectinatus brassicae]